MISRALPEGSKKTCENALLEHYKVLTGPVLPTADSILYRAKKFANKWARKYLRDNDFHPYEFNFSSGSCLGSTRREGGCAAWTRDRFEFLAMVGLPGNTEKVPHWVPCEANFRSSNR